jgi:glycosyltransferase involved in cell wall biosynthesis
VITGGTTGTWWEQTSLPRALTAARPDVVFAPAYTAPLAARQPLVLALHDVSFAAHPEWFTWREGLRRRVLSRLAARKARLVLTLTSFSRAEIERWLRIAPDKIRVISPATDAHPCLGGAPPDPGARSADGEPLILYVGSIFNRRHVPDLMAGFAALSARRPDVRLILVGENRTHPRQDLAALATELRITDRLTHIAWLDNAALQTLYGRARAFAFLSEYEGFGLTPLEALRAGVPVLVLDTPVAREVFGDAAEYVAAGDAAGISAALGRLVSDPVTRERLLNAGRRVLARYSWERTATETLAALEEAAT